MALVDTAVFGCGRPVIIAGFTGCRVHGAISDFSVAFEEVPRQPLSNSVVADESEWKCEQP